MGSCLVEGSKNIDIIIFAVVKFIVTGLMPPGRHEGIAGGVGGDRRLSEVPLTLRCQVDHRLRHTAVNTDQLGGDIV